MQRQPTAAPVKVEPAGFRADDFQAQDIPIEVGHIG